MPAAAPEPAPARVRPPASPARRRLTRAALALVALLGLVATYYVGLYFYADNAMREVDALVTDGPEVLAPQLQEGSRTYLLVATDLPGRTGLSAVSVLIAHVSEDDERAVLVTVPPTALNDTPSCRAADGELRQARTEPFAAALLDGGPSCLVRSVQQLTGLRVDHYVGVDVAELPAMVDAVDGVTVCVPGSALAPGGEAVPAGEHQVTGDGLAEWLRPGGADVTGAAVAQREQLVLSATLRAALARTSLADPLTLTRFLSRAGDVLTVDADTTLGDVRSLGTVLGVLPPDAVQRAEVPVAQLGYLPSGTDQAAVLVDARATRELFDAVIDAGRLPEAADPAAADPAADGSGDGSAEGGVDGAADGGSAPADALPAPEQADPVPEGTVVSVAPAGVGVDVFDGTGAGRTPEVAGALGAAGFRVGVQGVEPGAVDRTVVRYGPAALEPARTVAAAVPGALLVETDAVGSAVQLVVGPDYTGVQPVDVGAPVPTAAAPAPVGAGAGAASSCS